MWKWVRSETRASVRSGRALRILVRTGFYSKGTGKPLKSLKSDSDMNEFTFSKLTFVFMLCREVTQVSKSGTREPSVNGESGLWQRQREIEGDSFKGKAHWSQ